MSSREIIAFARNSYWQIRSCVQMLTEWLPRRKKTLKEQEALLVGRYLDLWEISGYLVNWNDSQNTQSVRTCCVVFFLPAGQIAVWAYWSLWGLLLLCNPVRPSAKSTYRPLSRFPDQAFLWGGLKSRPVKMVQWPSKARSIGLLPSSFADNI